MKLEGLESDNKKLLNEKFELSSRLRTEFQDYKLQSQAQIGKLEKELEISQNQNKELSAELMQLTNTSPKKET